MARLRVRVELNRGGVGVPMHKLSSVVQEAQRFFQMLAQDVRIATERGDWLAFDFDHESLNFTAEYVGPVSNEQVHEFCAAFDGVTSLRRATIAQFTRIADAIGEDELIGFGLYLSDHETEPSEWRCLSRRDALRIADEIQMLLGPSGELNQETHLPGVIDSGAGARLFKERRDRSLAAAESKLPDVVREVESNLSKRITRLEGEVENHSGQIRELREGSAAAEESFKGLLSAVENFCGQATRQLERLSPGVPALPGAAEPELPSSPGFNWRAVGVAAVVLLGIGITGLLFWTSNPVHSADRESPPASTPAPVSASVKPPAEHPLSPPAVEPAKPAEPTKARKSDAAAAPRNPVKPKATTVASDTATPSEPSADVMRVDLEAKEPVWVAITDVDGNTLMARTLQANETRSLELTKNATLRTGNAGGLLLKFNGKDIGPLGPSGKIRDVQFKDGACKIVAPEPANT
jgi:uncharacterized protein DUF4115